MSKQVLFLCSGNSARSQMAEGWVNARLAGSWVARSAGTKPTGYVQPLAVTAMGEIGIDITHQHSKHLDTVRDEAFDLVVTVCDNAAKSCPLWLGQGRVVHRGFPDPVEVAGSPVELLAAFRAVRDAIGAWVLPFLEEMDDELDATGKT
jgi:arsenate reductase